MKKRKIALVFAASALLLTGCNTGKVEPDTPVEVDTRKAITFEGNDTAFASGLVEKANEGEKVSFKVWALSGYEIVDVVVTDANNAEVAVTGDANNGYSFTMPSTDVKVIAHAQGAYFHVSIKDSSKVVVTPQKYENGAKTVNNFIGGFIVNNNDKVQSGDYIYARAGQEVYVLVNSIAFADNVDVTVNGVSAIKENYFVYNEAAEGEEQTVKYEYNAYKFVMPNGDVSIDVTAVEKTIKVVTEENEKVDAKTYRLVDDEKVYTNDFYVGETAYVDVTVKDEYKDNYLFKSCNYTYNTVSGYNLKETTTDTSAKEVTASATYSYSITSYTSYSSDIVFTFKIQELKYVGKEFVGSYYGKEFYGSSASNLPSSNTSGLTVDGAGNVKIKGSWSTTSLTIDESKYDETNKTFGTLSISGSTERTFHYDGKLIWSPYNSKDSSEETDIYVYIKDVSNWSNITINKNSDVAMASGKLAYVEFVDSTTNEFIGNFVKVDGVIYLNVTLKDATGTTLTTSDVTVDSAFNIYKGDTLLASHAGTSTK